MPFNFNRFQFSTEQKNGINKLLGSRETTKGQCNIVSFKYRLVAYVVNLYMYRLNKKEPRAAPVSWKLIKRDQLARTYSDLNREKDIPKWLIWFEKDLDA